VDVTQVLWGIWASAGLVSKLNKQIYEKCGLWRNRKLEGQFPYLYLDGIVLKRTWAEEVRNVSILIAFGVNEQEFARSLEPGKAPKRTKAVGTPS
jgi:putative transposase